MPPRLGILLSGTGSTYANLAAAIGVGLLPADIVTVVSSRGNVEGVNKARDFRHPVVIAETVNAVSEALRSARVEWVAMCGYMKYWDPPPEFAGRTVNIHPSLLPAFGGPGMYGGKVHEAVLKAGCRVSGCTVHLVSGGYDSGPIIAQNTVPVMRDDTAASLQQRVQLAERQLYPQALAALVTGRYQRHGAGYWLDV
jgi:phosphoribosylglycinamide formyltransferase 1